MELTLVNIDMWERWIRNIAREEANKAILGSLGYKLIDGKLYKEVDIEVKKVKNKS